MESKSKRRHPRAKASFAVVRKNTMLSASRGNANQRGAHKQRRSSTSIKQVTHPGYIQNRGGVLVPVGHENSEVVVPASKLSAGIEASKEQIKKSLQNITSIFTQDFEVAEVELSVSFSAEGKFLGFGGGGAMSLKIKIKPLNTEA